MADPLPANGHQKRFTAPLRHLIKYAVL